MRRWSLEANGTLHGCFEAKDWDVLYNMPWITNDLNEQEEESLQGWGQRMTEGHEEGAEREAKGGQGCIQVNVPVLI